MSESNAAVKTVHPPRGASPVEIPDKLYFRIGEVARIAQVKPYVLRFWETEFPPLGPKKSGTGHRLYRRKDVQLVLDIKHLLYEQRYTIEGARKFLEDRARDDRAKAESPVPAAQQDDPPPSSPAPSQPADVAPLLDTIRKDLREILAILK